MLGTLVGLSIAGLFVWATVGMMRKRSATRKIGMEVAQLNVMSNDTRRGFWSASADEGPSGGHAGGDGGGGDGGGGGD